jgi:hypothetical protein
LIQSFSDRGTGLPDSRYLGAVRQRFAQWILDTADASFDAAWLAYQLEIGRRHHRLGKNRTDGADSTALVPFRYLFPIVFPITATLRPFLAGKGHSDADVDGMQQAWLKSVLIQVTLWSQPYVREGDY